jgi:hypothetical protein
MAIHPEVPGLIMSVAVTPVCDMHTLNALLTVGFIFETITC